MDADDDISEELDSIIAARAMLDRLSEAIEIAHAVGAERLADVLEQARMAAQRRAGSRRSATVH